jgi:hypothetical protein
MVIKAGGILLLWLLSVTEGLAASPIRPSNRTCDPQTPALRKLVRQARSVGGPVARQFKKKLFRSRARTAHIERGTHRHATEDSQAIQNDAAVTHAAAAPLAGLRVLGIFVDRFEQLPFTHSASPQSPRGPPAAA